MAAAGTGAYGAALRCCHPTQKQTNEKKKSLNTYYAVRLQFCALEQELSLFDYTGPHKSTSFLKATIHNFYNWQPEGGII